MELTRRHFLAGTTAVASTAWLPNLSFASDAKTVTFAPISDLTGVDPIWTTSTAVRNYAYLVYDTLFGVDSTFQARPQMAEGHEVSEDSLKTTIRLREGLKWHDGEPVLARDCAASIRRWAARDGLGQIMLDRLDDIVAQDDRTIVLSFREPFPSVADALSKLGSPGPFMMPEHVAATDPNEQISSTVGSGPFRFLENEWARGSSLAFERFDGYVPRDEPASGTAGGKVVHVDRVEWKIIPDASTAMAALQSGALDWYETASTDLLPLVADNPDFTVVSLDLSGYPIILRLNHAVAPFDNVGLRRAVLTAVDQNLFLQATVGEGGFGQECKSFFPCGTAMSTGTGGEAMSGDLDAARKMVEEAGYDGTPVVILTPTDNPIVNACCLVLDEVLRSIGLKTDVQTMDIATMIQRRTSTEPVSNGGWSVFFAYGESAQFSNPATHIGLRADGRAAWPGWPENERLQELRLKWLLARSVEEQKEIAAEMERESFSFVPYVPVGQFQQPTVYRSSLSDVIRIGIPVFWNLRKA